MPETVETDKFWYIQTAESLIVLNKASGKVNLYPTDTTNKTLASMESKLEEMKAFLKDIKS